MSLFYKYFLGLRILHDYYSEGYSEDFKIVPLPQTRELMRRHRLILKESPKGFNMVSLMEDETTPFIDLGDDKKLSFALILLNKAFYNFTALDERDNFRQAHQLSNLNLNGREMTENGWSLAELKNTSFNYAITSQADTIDLTVTGPFGEEVFQGEMDKNGTRFSYLMELGNRSEGLYTFSTEVDEVAQPDELFYLAQDLVKLRPFAIIDLYSSELSYARANRYSIQFEAKKAQWKYLLNLGKDYTGSTISIQDTRDTPEITFKSTGRNDLSSGSLLTFESFKADNEAEAAEIGYSDKPIPDFDLIIEKNGNRIEVSGLPNPSIQDTKTEMHINI